MKVIQVDGGQHVEENAYLANSIGLLYPAERVDLIMTWAESALDTDTEIIIDLDNE